ncbi:MAG: hypothetical protein LBQ15_02380 [Clostridium sp.]|nr:hypothetical protein [Clostridium sp.]
MRGLKKREGKAEAVLSVAMLLFLVPAVAVGLQAAQFRATGAFVEDALAASCLASAVIDIREYGGSGNLVIKDPEAAYALYRQALQANLDLDASWRCRSRAAISGEVEALAYAVYNVWEHGPLDGAGDPGGPGPGDVEVFSFDSRGMCSRLLVRGGLGSVSAPDGTVVRATSVYGRIGFPVEGAFGVSLYARREQLADICGPAAGGG